MSLYSTTKLMNRSVGKKLIPNHSSPFSRYFSILKSPFPNYDKFDAKYPFKSLPEMQEKSCEMYKDKNLFGVKNGSTFDWITYKEFGKQVQYFRNVLKHHNIGKNDKVAIISNNRIEWAVTMYAAAGLGAQIVSMYEAQPERDWRYILNDSESKIVVLSTEKIYSLVNSYVGKVGKVESVLCYDAPEESMHSYKRWMKIVQSETPVPAIQLEPKDLLSLVYTSGTTGNPKGVQLTHHNILSNIRGAMTVGELNGGNMIEGQTALVFLPWAHIYGQTCELHAYMCAGSAMALVSREQLLESIPIVRPTAMNTVPMLYNRIYDAVQKRISEGSPLQKLIFSTALAASNRRTKRLEALQSPGFWLELQYKLFDRLVFSKIRDRLGGRIVCMSSGGAALSDNVMSFFTNIGLLVGEGYGLTETSPVVSFNGPEWKSRRLGTVGVLIPGVEVRIVNPVTLESSPEGENGEICVTGDCVMVGYHNNPKANQEVFYYADGKRYFRTGDQGQIVDGKFLKITGRIKELFKLENGKYVIPPVVEDTINRSQFIAQTFLYGENRPYTVALIVPEISEVQGWLKKNHPTSASASADPATMLADPVVQNLLSDEIISACASLKSYERPHAWVSITEPFTQDNQMLTPKLSMKRGNIMKTYGHLVTGMYTKTAGVQIGRQVPIKDEEH